MLDCKQYFSLSKVKTFGKRNNINSFVMTEGTKFIPS